MALGGRSTVLASYFVFLSFSFRKQELYRGGGTYGTCLLQLRDIVNTEGEMLAKFHPFQVC